MLSPLDYAVIAFYFLFMAGLGWFFRRFAADSSDFFRGGGKMPWWMVGASVFMVSFSAWTFTGAAGLAYDGGIIALTIFLANGLQLFIASTCFAAWYRQTRAITFADAIRQRFGLANQQILLWLSLPVSLLRSAIGLYGLAIFLAPVFHLDVVPVIVASAVMIVLVSAVGGSWAVVTGDFMQALLLMPITMVAAWLAIAKAGGAESFLHHLPATHFDFAGRSLPGYGLLWLLATGVERLLLGNGLGWSARFFYVSDSKSARRAAICAGVLFLLGTLLWFIPPLATRSLGIDLAARFHQLSKPSEAAYAAMALLTLPPGLLGLLVTGLIAATLSHMDHGLNGNAGNFVRGIYRPLLRPGASERELVLAGRLATATFGVLIMLLALKYSTWRGVGVFTLMFNLTAMVGTPQAVPMLWCLFTRRGPDAAFWSTLVVGLVASAALGWLPRQDWIIDLAGAHGWRATTAWIRTNEYAVITIVDTVLCSAWYWGMAWWGPQPTEPRKTEVDNFFEAMHTPVLPDAATTKAAAANTRSVSRMCNLYGCFLVAIALFPNNGWGRGGLLFCATFFFATGQLLQWMRRRDIRQSESIARSAL